MDSSFRFAANQWMDDFFLGGWPIFRNYLSFRMFQGLSFWIQPYKSNFFGLVKKTQSPTRCKTRPIQSFLAEFKPPTIRQATILSHCLFHDSFIWTSWTIDGYGRLFATVFPCPFRLCFRLNHLISFWVVISKIFPVPTPNPPLRETQQKNRPKKKRGTWKWVPGWRSSRHLSTPGPVYLDLFQLVCGVIFPTTWVRQIWGNLFIKPFTWILICWFGGWKKVSSNVFFLKNGGNFHGDEFSMGSNP